MSINKRVLFFALAMMSSGAMAQYSDQMFRVKDTNLVISGSLGSVSKDAQNQGGIGDSAWATSIGMRWDINYFWNAQAGISMHGFDDQQPFTEFVENSITGNEGDEDSKVYGYGTYGEFGYVEGFRTEVPMEVGINLGYEYISTSRSIMFCSDCESEDIDINGGLYWRPFVNIQLTDSIFTEFSYKGSFAEELESFFQISLMMEL